MQLGNSRRRVAAALVDADDPHSESGGEPRHLAADAADADDQCGCLGQMDDAGIPRQFLPFAAHLLGNVVVQPAGKGQHKGHHMGADVVVVDLAEIGDRHRMRDQLGVVIPGRRCGLRRLQPAQPLGLAQQVGRDRPEYGIGMSNHLRRMRVVFGNNDLELGHRGGEARPPLAGLIGLRRQHHEFGRHREFLPAGTGSGKPSTGEVERRTATR